MMSMLHACVPGFEAESSGEVAQALSVVSSPAPTADIHTGAAAATKSRNGGKGKWELPRRLAVRQGPSPASSKITFAGQMAT